MTPFFFDTLTIFNHKTQAPWSTFINVRIFHYLNRSIIIIRNGGFGDWIKGKISKDVAGLCVGNASDSQETDDYDSLTLAKAKYDAI